MTLGPVAGLAEAEARRARLDAAEIGLAPPTVKLKVQVDPYNA